MKRKREVNWWKRVLLWFKPSHYCEDGPLMTLKYKWLFGRKYVFQVIAHPPFHPNCRCHIEVNP